MKQRSFLSILCFVLISLGVSSVSAQTCMNRGSFVPNGTYDSNLRLILSSFPFNVMAQDGFYYSSIGQEPDRAYAIGMCIPGSAPDDCSDCVKYASGLLLQSCTNQTDAFHWSIDPTLCLVRYSNASFSKSADLEPRYLVFNTANISSNLTDFTSKWEGLTLRLISAASASKSTPYSSNNHYKADVAALTPFQNMYALMQCTPHLQSSDCENCLRQSVSDYQSSYGQKIGGYVMRPICFFRWQFFTFSKAFGNITLTPPPPPPPPSRRPVNVPQQPSAGDRAETTDKKSRKFSVETIVAIAALGLLVVIIIFVLLAQRFSMLCWRKKSYHQEVELNQTDITTVRSLKYNFKTIKTATKKFSERIGRGGFGEVFKGTFPNGKEVAVKRLSGTSKQGEREFKNEVLLVAKLHHANLVRLLGFSVKGKEKILVYEFVPNRSLDFFLSDPAKQRQLDWTKRYNIIKGITRGILYLHQDVRPTIIHRDLKAANILLDANMNPKIADFGMARILGIDESEAKTERPAGTFGYIPPEYNQGLISVKTDVYSFGVLVLEIICGQKNLIFYQESTTAETLVAYAWRMWRYQTPLELVDTSTTISENCQTEEVTRCINIALLCVQHDPTDRPNLSTINVMLTSNSVFLPVPKQPGLSDTPSQSTMSSSNYQSINNEIT